MRFTQILLSLSGVTKNLCDSVLPKLFRKLLHDCESLTETRTVLAADFLQAHRQINVFVCTNGTINNKPKKDSREVFLVFWKTAGSSLMWYQSRIKVDP